jgi:hypothetical protein
VNTGLPKISSFENFAAKPRIGIVAPLNELDHLQGGSVPAIRRMSGGKTADAAGLPGDLDDKPQPLSRLRSTE